MKKKLSFLLDSFSVFQFNVVSFREINILKAGS